MKPRQIWLRLRGRAQRETSRRMFKRSFEMCNDAAFISFTFDDFPRSALVEGGAILHSYGVAGTYYASLGLMGQETPTGRIFLAEDLDPLLAKGHELGCHTFDHCHSWDTKPSVFERSIYENATALNSVLPGSVFKSFSYPLCCPRPFTKRRVGRHFTCCRGGGQTFNVGTADLNHLSAYFLEKSRDRPAAVEQAIDMNCRAHGWLILATHDVCEEPTPYGCTSSFFERIVRHAVKSGARVLPVFEAWKIIKERKRSLPKGGGANLVQMR